MEVEAVSTEEAVGTAAADADLGACSSGVTG
jgi:hypothetical protein